MFVPSLLEESRPEVLWGLMDQNPLGALVVCDKATLDANHLPFEVDRPAGRLRTHVSRANPLWTDAPPDGDVLVIFQGANHYISPGWQPGRARHGRVAPSWNYAVVHAYCELRFVDDEQWLFAHLAALTAREEAHRTEPWSLDAAPEDFLGALVRQIGGVELTINRLVGKSQACQQYSEATRVGVVAGLTAEGTAEAAAMAAVIQSTSLAGV